MMPTRCASSSRNAPRFPVPESLLQDATLQPYIHNCQVTIHEDRHTYRFCIFFKRHCHLVPNPLLSGMGCLFRGDVVVMRVGEGSSVVNMRGRDVAIADFMITRSVERSIVILNTYRYLVRSFARRVSRLTGSYLPRSLTFDKPLSCRVSQRLQARQM